MEENEAGIIVPSLELPVDEELLSELFAFICQGLLWHHFGVILGAEQFVNSGALSEYGEDKYKREFFPTTEGVVWGDLGPDIFQYVGRQGSECQETSLWLMRFYSGVALTEKFGDQKSTCFVGITGNTSVDKMAKLRAKFGIAT